MSALDEASTKGNIRPLAILIAEYLRRRTGGKKTIVEQRAERGNTEAAMRILREVVPDVPPDEGDELRG